MMNTFIELMAIRDEKIARAFVTRIVKSWLVYNEAIRWMSRAKLRELIPDGATLDDPIQGKQFRDVCERNHDEP